MSYQPQAPGVPPPAWSPASAQAPVPAVRGRRRPLLIVLGLLVLLSGLAAAVVLVLRSSSVTDDSIGKLARAPAGCTTTLDFDTRGTFMVFYESKGRLSNVGGNCAGNGRSYERSGDVPKQTLRLANSKDNDVSLTSASGTTYDSNGFKGELIRKVSISTPGVYRLTVDTTETGYAISVGRDPTANRGKLRAAALGAGIAGVLLGGLLVLLGLRRRPPAADGPTVGSAAPMYSQPSPSATTMWQPTVPAAAPTPPVWSPTPPPRTDGDPTRISPVPPSPWPPAAPGESTEPRSPFAPPSADDRRQG